MIVFGTAVTSREMYSAYCAPGIDRVAEPDSEVIAHQSIGTIYKNYNLLFDLAAEHEDLEALVLLHQDAEIADDGFCATIREALSDPDVAIVGCAGATGVRSIAWWEGAVTWASFTHRYNEIGGGQFNSLSWHPSPENPLTRTGEVDSLDGFIMAFSPWAVRNLRFDETLGSLHGYDFDICCQAREAGKKIVTADFRMIHHHSLELISNPETWVEAYIRLAEKWEGRLTHLGEHGGDAHARALRSEAEAAAAKAMAMSHQLRYQALERHYYDLVGSQSWRITAPLRRLKFALQSRRARLRSARAKGPAAEGVATAPTDP